MPHILSFSAAENRCCVHRWELECEHHSSNINKSKNLQAIRIALCNKIVFSCRRTRGIQPAARSTVCEQCMHPDALKVTFLFSLQLSSSGLAESTALLWTVYWLFACVYLRACILQSWPSADCTPWPTCQVAQFSRSQSEDQMVIAGFRCVWHSVSLNSSWRLPLSQTNIHTCKYKQDEGRKWVKAFNVVFFLMWVRNKMLNVVLEILFLVLLNISSDTEGEVQRGCFLKWDKEYV